MSNAVWKCGLFQTQSNQTAIDASYSKIESGQLQMKANVGCGWDFLNAVAMLDMALPSQYAIEFRVNKPLWCGHFILSVTPTNDFPQPLASTNFFTWFISGDWFAPIFVEGATMATINPISSPFSLGSWYNFRLERSNTGLRVYANGTLQYSYTGALFEGGYLRLEAGSSGSTIQVDGLKIYDLGTPLTIEVAAVRLRWPTQSNTIYQVQWSSDMQSWSNLTTIVGTGSDTNLVDWTDGPRKFYRLTLP